MGGGSGGLFGGSNIDTSGLTSLAGDMTGLAGQQASLAGPLADYGLQTLPTAENQFQQGAAGQLTPGWQALSQNQLQQANLGTTAQYGNLGLGDSTMKQQDIGANTINNLAEQGNLAALTEQLGIQGLSTGSGMVTGAGNLLSGAAGTLSGAGSLTQSALADQLTQATQGKNSLTSGLQAAGGIGSALGGIF